MVAGFSQRRASRSTLAATRRPTAFFWLCVEGPLSKLTNHFQPCCRGHAALGAWLVLKQRSFILSQ